MEIVKKTLAQSLVFPVMWVLYCAARMLQDPSKRIPLSVGGMFVGAVFLFAVGFLLLRLLRGKNLSARSLVLGGIMLIAADQLAKVLVNSFLAPDRQIQIVASWLSIEYAPNHNNSVLFNLLGVKLPAPWMDIALKIAIVAVLGVMLAVYLRRNQYLIQDARMPMGILLVAASAVCSTIDTIVYGFVLDFIGFAGLLAFDFKDLYMMFGIALCAVAHWELEREQEQKKTAGKQAPKP